MKEREISEKAKKIIGIGLTATPLIEPIRQKLMVGNIPECTTVEAVMGIVGIGILLNVYGNKDKKGGEDK